MSHEELLALLTRDEPIRDDVAEICMAIDDALPDESRVQVKRVTLERSAA